MADIRGPSPRARLSASRVNATPETAARQDIAELTDKFSDDDLNAMRDKGLDVSLVRVPRPIEPLGMTAVFDRAVSPRELRTADEICQSLQFVLERLKTEPNTVQKELLEVAQQTLLDEIWRNKKAVAVVQSVIEV